MPAMATTRFEQYARIAAIALLVIGCFLVLQPFMGAILFAGILCFSTWPVFLTLRDRLGGRSWLAALVIAVILNLAVVVPGRLAGPSLALHSAALVELVRGVLDQATAPTMAAFHVHTPGTS